ncbi:MAG: aspartate-semialdehyde dehydrogenase [Flavobacteriales bacterium]|nr:aspartate-semialdehyde dehydrogenase [Flavobacteriales bacterium]
MKLAIIGITGMVGREMLEVLNERNFHVTDLIPVASRKSCGKLIKFKNKNYKIISLSDLLEKKVDIALFSAGSDISKIWAPKLVEKGCKVIDNSSYWRMNKNYKLIVPEINGSTLCKNDMIISSPNCSTIQLVMALAPLHKKLIIDRVIVSTYQAVSGTGKKAIDQLNNEILEQNIDCIYPHQIYSNVLPQCDDFTDNGYTKEEMKLTLETKKILDDNINVVATAVRVPVFRGHSESVNISFTKEFTIDQIKKELDNMSGVRVMDDIVNNEYPMPINTTNQDLVFVGRIRRDFTNEKTLNMWIVADNLRKGAATNTVQIAEYLLDNNLF